MKNLINHVSLVIDESSSMSGLRHQVIKVVDQQISYLAERSKALNQETRITIYTFATHVKCLIYDMDVLRLPSLETLYNPYGNTALIDATNRAITEMQETATRYGDHAFLQYVLTDGEDNQSYMSPGVLSSVISGLPDNWTVAVMVPNARGEFNAKQCGFAKNNIAIWDTTEKGFIEAGNVIRESTENFMQARATGVRSTRNLFSLDPSSIKDAVKQGVLKRIKRGNYQAYTVDQPGAISDFVSYCTGKPYVRGSAFYQLTKSETVQSQKHVAVREKTTYDLITGPEARQLLNLPNYEVTVRPIDHDQYDVFIQSTSPNRKLVPGTTVLVLPQFVGR